ncbi:DUF520 family protein [Acidithiobacillus ferrooxidans]|uniref:DUF520 family protein n=1 Tax=Acidithiobacillus ferrooxidans TaxID=920 RepID=A0A2W1K445_ACIFR|nr:DUF520 family protein [Acidithiobacillus sp. MC2.2]MBN6747330.1 DUF520 family protein [Acidithiobacillus sp. PG05]MBU2772544.1 DUF520 family protein [Acidithiobacillus ferrooxidans]MBU2819060.1 DUF520 family protein [Acidithiobacillus ferrooxidans]MBU2823951.1 DUF520 family protein [Acidithiobacillus ferrooxidans]
MGVTMNGGKYDFKSSKTTRKREGGASQHPGDRLRVSGRCRDMLQTIIAALRGQDFGLAPTVQ